MLTLVEDRDRGDHESLKGAFSDAVTDLLFGLYPLYEREEPTTIGSKSASYCAEVLYDTALGAIEAGRAVVDGAHQEEEPQWVRLFHATVVASAIIAGSGPDAPLEPLKSAYEVLSAAQQATWAPAAASTND